MVVSNGLHICTEYAVFTQKQGYTPYYEVAVASQDRSKKLKKNNPEIEGIKLSKNQHKLSFIKVFFIII